MTIKIVLADDHQIVRHGLRSLLEAEPDMKVVAEADNGRSVLRLVKESSPDVVIMDIRMPGLDGIAAAREIRFKYPHVKVIGLSEYAYGYNTDAMEQAGALGVYQKSNAFEELYPAIKKVTARLSESQSYL